MTLTLNHDRAAGVLLGCACGDALGAGYEFLPDLPDQIGMVGGGLGGFAPGEWTDDTSMAVAIAEAAAAGHDLRSPSGLDAVATGFTRWYSSKPKDVGVHTSAVLSAATRQTPDPSAEELAMVARHRFTAGHRSAGNGTLMRTAPVALAHLGDPQAVAEAARAVSDLTHGDPTCAEACVIWSLGIRHAVLYGSFDGVRDSLSYLPEDRAEYWSGLLDEAEANEPSSFTQNGWVVQALQAAWSAITRTPVPELDPAAGSFPARHFPLAVEAAVRAGVDTDTVGAIAGSLLGARWGASAVPLAWRRQLHGWPGYRARDLVRLGVQAARQSLDEPPDDAAGWPGQPRLSYAELSGTSALAVHPHDPGVILGGIDPLYELPDGVDAVVSLCRLGADEAPAIGVDPADHIEVWLIDDNDPRRNPHLPYVIDQAARAVAGLRAEGRTVLLHCVQAQSRTPSVAARYAAVALEVPAEDALREVCAALPDAAPQSALRDSVLSLGTAQ